MKTARLLATILFLCCLAPLAGAAEEPLFIEEVGIGPLRIGMSKTDLDGLGMKLTYFPPDEGEVGIYCTDVEVAELKLSLIVEEGVLSRIYFFKSNYATRSGIKVGDPEKRVRATYGKALKIEPHAYNEGFYLFKLNKQGVGLLFETDRGIISSISIGRRPTIGYIEGCL